MSEISKNNGDRLKVMPLCRALNKNARWRSLGSFTILYENLNVSVSDQKACFSHRQPNSIKVRMYRHVR